ncbi:MAG TPA: hypothetical protein PKW79_03845 [Rhabdochlamydiaceae bacterium]|nr:hypothetical protein [Rhabdochlamydiaceae bacterium]
MAKKRKVTMAKVTCPMCKCSQSVRMPKTVCKKSCDCKGCGKTIRGKKCCLFCDHSNKCCPACKK